MIARRTARPLWLVTLADLALLLVGFFVFIQATSRESRKQQAAISAGIRQAFGGDADARIAVEANAISFAPGSAAAPDLTAIREWARDALTDSRTRLIVTGYADGTDADRLDGSSLSLAGRRADAAIAGLAGIVPAERVRSSATVLPNARRVTLTISYDP